MPARAPFCGNPPSGTGRAAGLRVVPRGSSSRCAVCKHGVDQEDRQMALSALPVVVLRAAGASPPLLVLGLTASLASPSTINPRRPPPAYHGAFPRPARSPRPPPEAISHVLRHHSPVRNGAVQIRRSLFTTLTGTFPRCHWSNKIGRGQGKGCELCARKRDAGSRPDRLEVELIGHIPVSIQSAY